MAPVIYLEIYTLSAKIIPLAVEDAGVQELWRYLDAFLSYDINNSMFIKAMSSNRWIQDQWDGRSHLFNVKTGEFPTGLLYRVLGAFTQFKIDYTFIDNRPNYKPHNEELVLDGLKLRNYQEVARDLAIRYKRGIIWARPRAGKTIIEIAMVAKINEFPVLSICQSIDIARQTVDKFKQFLPGVPVGIIGGGECNIQPITISTIQSIMSAYDIKEKIKQKDLEVPPNIARKLEIQHLVEHAKVVWIDESHHAAAQTYKYILRNKIYAAEYIIGCSGTPFREDNTDMLIEGLIGPIIYEVNYSKLISEGFLVRPLIHIVKIPKVHEFEKTDTYATIYKDGVVDNDIRNNVIIRATADLTNRDKTCMVLVKTLRHGHLLNEKMPFAEFSHAKSENRTTLWAKLKIRSLKCLITTLGDEGIDIPSLDATVIAAGGDSAIKVFQRMRCMTPFEGKSTAIILDFLDPYKYLRKHSKKREYLYKSEPSFQITYKKATV